MHRAHNGPDYEGDWAWTPPAGSRFPDEPIDTCAVRELAEETGLSGALRAVRGCDSDWALFQLDCEAPPDVSLDAEHDRYEWVTLSEARLRCRPQVIVAGLDLAVRNHQ
jgi:8-oxo-dGTP pyrophosphatase MutT (NUDIX family)